MAVVMGLAMGPAKFWEVESWGFVGSDHLRQTLATTTTSGNQPTQHRAPGTRNHSCQ